MLPTLIARASSLWRAIRRRADVESEVGEEFRAHIEYRTADLIRHGVERWWASPGPSAGSRG